ncbi:stage II sporulation protein M [Desulfitibacter alkalitolerans]|uniref:stage II sporulation protein M n=1 Tax=Desulfitibacter alkalitolerans TaxID=264641 RepID=UPI000485E997|nr:stage II sporulation protein M [Desulfitibacter alkalitolerans]
MIKALLKLWFNHIRDHMVLYILSTLMFLGGSSLGAFTVSTLNEYQLQELVDYFDYFLKGLTGWNINSVLVAQDAIFNNLKFIFLTWALGLTVIGIPIILLIVSFKGFIMGFTVGFLILQKGLAGMLIAIFAVLPQNFFYVPSLMICAVASITFSLCLLRGTMGGRKLSISQMFINYILLLLVFCVFTVIGGLIEGYGAPLTMKIIITYFQ